MLSEYSLDFRLSLCILLQPLLSNCFFFFDFPLFGFFSLLITTTFSLIYSTLLLARAFSLVFIDFTLFKFSFYSSTSSTFFLWFSFVFCCFFFKFLFEHFNILYIFYFDHLSCSFPLTDAFSLVSCCWWLLLFVFCSWKFLAAFMLCDSYFLLQCNFILNYFWSTSSGGCSNHTFQRLIPQGTHNQGGQAHLATMHLLTKSFICHCSFQITLHLLVKTDISSFRHYLPFLHTF